MMVSWYNGIIMSRTPPSGFRYEYIDQDDYSEEMEGAYNLFNNNGIHLHRLETPSVVMIKGDSIVGAVSWSLDPFNQTASFSVAVDEQFRRSGIASYLIDKVIEDAEADEVVIELHAEVVNPIAMTPLLKSKGFVKHEADPRGRLWVKSLVK